MASTDLLETFVHLHLATDVAAASNLPSIISVLSSSNLESSSHLTKWTNRVNSLIRSREANARWAGITLAFHTSKLSRNVLMGSASGWISVVLPMLSRSESIAVSKVAIRFLAFVFTSTTDLSEFQRHVVTPNVPKFSSALSSLAEKQADEELRVLCLDVLATIVPLYPTLHRQMASTLSSLTLNFLNGSPTFTPLPIIASASRLHACLYTTAGKVGGAALWRESVEETVEFCSAAVVALRTTYTTDDKQSSSQSDPLIDVPLNLDRLRCGTELLCHLLRVKVDRPVIVPVRLLVNLCIDMLRVTKDGPVRSDVDPSLWNMEAAAVLNVLQEGCSLTGCLARCVQSRFAPHLTRILGVVVYHLEQPNLKKERLSLIKLLPSLLGSCLPLHDPLICGRIIKSILPMIARLLSQNTPEESKVSVEAGSKKGKKRARGYEGDEVFKVGRGNLCESTEDAELVLAALEALAYLLRVPNIPTYLQSLSSRLLLSLLVALPELPSASVASGATVKDRILRLVKNTCVELASGSSAALSQSLPLVLQAVTHEEVSSDNLSHKGENALLLDFMLHPRLPPLLRALPPLEAITLFPSEEGTEEHKARESLGLRSTTEDIEMDGETTHQDDRSELKESERNSGQSRFVTGPPPAAPVVIPAVPVRPAAPVVVQPIATPSQVLPSAEPSTLQEQPTNRDSYESPLQSNHEGEPTPGAQAVPVIQPSQQPMVETKSQPTSRPSAPTRMIVDDEDDEEDIEMPPIDLASPSDSEIE